MSRKKEYIETEVLEKAMNLFWTKGYEHTSLQMLEKEMGINKFSIYSSFGNKENLFVESMKLYRCKVEELAKELEASSVGVIALKKYFYNFLKITESNGFGKGCLITNTLTELDEETNKIIVAQVEGFREFIRQLFLNNLKYNSVESPEIIERKADYLLVSMIGLSSASRVCNNNQLKNYIENTFNKL
tara:strand:- start:6467 stop:7030 length:564 start_codon:yes stop_codon:yes gene_type:complete